MLTTFRKVPAPSGTAIIRQLDFTPMDAFMAHVLESFRLDAELACRVFPSGARVVYSFGDRVAMDVIGEYINTLLGQTRIMSPDLSLRATAASFVQAWKLVDVTMEVLGAAQKDISRSLIENIIYQMFEPQIDEYLDDETEWVKGVLGAICNNWDTELGTSTKGADGVLVKNQAQSQPQFLTAQNPDVVKRNVLAGFKDALLLPVTIVPRTVTFGVNAIVAGGSHAVAGLSMLNPQKWAASTTTTKGQAGKTINGEVVFDGPIPGPDGDAVEELTEQSFDETMLENIDDVDALPTTNGSELTVPEAGDFSQPASPAPPSNASTPIPKKSGNAFERMQLLVSLDTALELIHGDREALKRAETFAKYPGKTGTKVVEAIEEIFIDLLKAVGDRHIAPGFRM